MCFTLIQIVLYRDVDIKPYQKELCLNNQITCILFQCIVCLKTLGMI